MHDGWVFFKSYELKYAYDFSSRLYPTQLLVTTHMYARAETYVSRKLDTYMYISEPDQYTFARNISRNTNEWNTQMYVKPLNFDVTNVAII